MCLSVAILSDHVPRPCLLSVATVWPLSPCALDCALTLTHQPHLRHHCLHAPNRPSAVWSAHADRLHSAAIEVTKIGHGSLSKDQAAANGEGVTGGDDWVSFTIRVRNWSKSTVDLFSSPSVSYGPDGDSAKAVFFDGALGGLTGNCWSVWRSLAGGRS